MKVKTEEGYLRRGDIEYLKIAMDQVISLKDFSLQNFYDNLKTIQLEDSLEVKYFGHTNTNGVNSQYTDQCNNI